MPKSWIFLSKPYNFHSPAFLDKSIMWLNFEKDDKLQASNKCPGSMLTIKYFLPPRHCKCIPFKRWCVFIPFFKSSCPLCKSLGRDRRAHSRDLLNTFKFSLHQQSQARFWVLCASLTLPQGLVLASWQRAQVKPTGPWITLSLSIDLAFTNLLGLSVCWFSFWPVSSATSKVYCESTQNKGSVPIALLSIQTNAQPDNIHRCKADSILCCVQGLTAASAWENLRFQGYLQG